MHANRTIEDKHTQSIRLPGTGRVRGTLLSDVVQERRERYPDLEHGRQHAAPTARWTTHIDAFVRKRVEHLKRLVLVLH